MRILNRANFIHRDQRKNKSSDSDQSDVDEETVVIDGVDTKISRERALQAGSSESPSVRES